MHHERARPSSGCQRASAPWESAAAGEKWRKEIFWAMMGGFGSDASTGHMAHVCPLLPGGGPVGPAEPCLALQGAWQHVDAQARALQRSPEKQGFIVTGRFHQIISKTLSAEKYWKQSTHVARTRV